MAIGAFVVATTVMPCAVVATALKAQASPINRCGGSYPLSPGTICTWTPQSNPDGTTSTWNIYFRFADLEPSWQVQWGFDCTNRHQGIGVSQVSPVFSLVPLVNSYGPHFQRLAGDSKVAPAHGFWASPKGVPLDKDSSVVTYTGDGDIDLQVDSNCQWSVAVKVPLVPPSPQIFVGYDAVPANSFPNQPDPMSTMSALGQWELVQVPGNKVVGPVSDISYLTLKRHGFGYSASGAKGVIVEGTLRQYNSETPNGEVYPVSGMVVDQRLTVHVGGGAGITYSSVSAYSLHITGCTAGSWNPGRGMPLYLADRSGTVMFFPSRDYKPLTLGMHVGCEG